MPQAINPFDDQPYNDSIIAHSNINPNDNLPHDTVAVRMMQPKSGDITGVKYIEWGFLHNNAENAEYQKIKPLIQGLWQNGYPLVEHHEIISLRLLQDKLAAAPIPRTPKDKIDNLILHIAKNQTEDGSSVTFRPSIVFKKLYFRTASEFEFYSKALVTDGLLQLNTSTHDFYYASLTHKGLLYAAALEQQQIASRICFVAMSFNPALNHLYTEAIKPACEATGFEALRIDDGHHPDAEQTINDAIIAGIKRSRFCIADFTQHKGGVYFEAGYALGRGLKVIYTCRRDDFQNAHFDTSHYPHLVYDTSEELRELLINKIEAWIKD